MESVTRFITHRLKLKVNQAKSAESRRRIAPKAIARFKQRI